MVSVRRRDKQADKMCMQIRFKVGMGGLLVGLAVVGTSEKSNYKVHRELRCALQLNKVCAN